MILERVHHVYRLKYWRCLTKSVKEMRVCERGFLCTPIILLVSIRIVVLSLLFVTSPP